MDIPQWLIQFQVINESAQVIQDPSVNSVLFAAYAIVSLLIKRVAYAAAFFVSCILFDAAVFDILSEASLYLLTFAVYSYVIFDIERNRKASIACGTIILLSIVLAYDSYHYGIGGIYGAHKTIVYEHIQHFALYAHIVFISTLVPYRRISDSFRRYVSFIVRMSRSSVNFVVL